jgi:hypothetical protein
MFCTRKNFMRVSRNLTVCKFKAAQAKEARKNEWIQVCICLGLRAQGSGLRVNGHFCLYAYD